MTLEVPKQNRGKDKSNEDYERLRFEFAAWLLDPNRTGSLADWATAHDLDDNTLTAWKRHPDVRAHLQKWREEMRSSVPEVVAAVFRRAVTGDLNAARLIGDWFGLNAPKDLNLTGQIDHIAYMPAGSLARLAAEVIEGEVHALPALEETHGDSEYPVSAPPPPSEGPPVSGEVPSGGGGTAER